MFWQRTQSNFPSAIPAAFPVSGSKLSRASTSAHTSPSAVREAKAESSKLVRPEHAAPQISVIAPRGNPPTNASISDTPVDTNSKALRSRYAKGEATRPRKSDSILERRVTSELAAMEFRASGEGTGVLRFLFAYPDSPQIPASCQAPAAANALPCWKN